MFVSLFRVERVGELTPRAFLNVVFVCIGGWWFWLWDPHTRWVRLIFHKCECLLRRIELWLFFDMFIFLLRVEMGRRADSACLLSCRFRLHRWTMILTLRPTHLSSSSNISQVWVSIVKNLFRAFIWYFYLSIKSQNGLEFWLRVPCKLSFLCALVGDDFDFETPSLGEYARYFTSVSVYCEGFS